MELISHPTKGTVTNKRIARRAWIYKMLVYGGFTLTEITKSVRFYEKRDSEWDRYGWE